jgi:predicted RNA-binding protein with TRAM domain
MSYEEARSGYEHSVRKPVELGKEYDVTITELSRRGDGIARIQGFVVFIKGGKVGQKPRVKITNVGERFAIGEIV